MKKKDLKAEIKRLKIKIIGEQNTNDRRKKFIWELAERNRRLRKKVDELTGVAAPSTWGKVIKKNIEERCEGGE